MNIKFTKDSDIMNVALEGRLDSTTAPEFEKMLCQNYDGASALTIDCEKLVYISSAGLRVLLGAHKKTNGAMKLTHVGEMVMEVFEMTGFADILTIE